MLTPVFVASMTRRRFAPDLCTEKALKYQGHSFVSNVLIYE
jgi:hypothetical protein